MAPMTDQECFQALARGGRAAREALGALYEQHSRKLLAHLRRKGFSFDQAEDIVQEVFVNIARLGERAATVEHPRAYLWRALENHAMDVLRKRKELTAADLPGGDDPEDGFDMDLLPAEVLSDEQNPGFLECFQRTLNAFFRDNPEGAKAINLAVIEGYTGEELAEAIGRTHGATREFLSQCRKKFAKMLMEFCHDYVPESARTA